MAFWVTGRDATTGEPGRMLSDAATAEDARVQAQEQGLVPDTVEVAEPAPEAPSPRPRRQLPYGLLRIGVGTGLLFSCVWNAALNEVYRTAGKGDFATVVVVVLYLVLPIWLIWSGAKQIEPKRDRA